jgi:hypothetical protein
MVASSAPSSSDSFTGVASCSSAWISSSAASSVEMTIFTPEAGSISGFSFTGFIVSVFSLLVLKF